MNTKSIVKIFEENIKSVEKLIHFDRGVLDVAIDAIKDLKKTLTEQHSFENPALNGEKVLNILENIREHDSLKLNYVVINNQAIVLLVSYFGSAIADLFRTASTHAIEVHKDKKVLGSELKLSITELLNLGDSIKMGIGDLLISKNTISFQDMQSIKREFDKYFGIEIEKTDHVNNIILGQACRHSIVHAAGIVNQRVLKQIGNARPRTLKKSLEEDQPINFDELEIKTLSESMIFYVKNLASQVDEYEQAEN